MRIGKRKILFTVERERSIFIYYYYYVELEQSRGHQRAQRSGVLRKEDEDASGGPPGHAHPVRACGANGIVEIVYSYLVLVWYVPISR